MLSVPGCLPSASYAPFNLLEFFKQPRREALLSHLEDKIRYTEIQRSAQTNSGGHGVEP